MLRHLGLIAVCACIVAGVGCDDGKVGKFIGPDPPPPAPAPGTTVTVELGGRAVNAEAEGAVGGVRVSFEGYSAAERAPVGWVRPTNTATSDEDGAFTLPLNLPSSWRFVFLKLTAPPGYDDRYESFGSNTIGERPAIRMYQTLSIRPGESIDVRVDGSIVWCGWDGYACRRVLVAASPGESVELEVVSHDSSRPMALGLANPTYPFILEPDMAVRRLMVPPGGVPYVIGDYPTGIATLTARR